MIFSLARCRLVDHVTERYKLVKKKRNWTQASKYCSDRNAKLVAIADRKEQDALTLYLIQQAVGKLSGYNYRNMRPSIEDGTTALVCPMILTFTQGCKCAGTHRNGDPVGIFAAGTPFLFGINLLPKRRPAK